MRVDEGTNLSIRLQDGEVLPVFPEEEKGEAGSEIPRAEQVSQGEFPGGESGLHIEQQKGKSEYRMHGRRDALQQAFSTRKSFMTRKSISVWEKQR